jgi:hypothetical protein
MLALFMAGHRKAERAVRWEFYSPIPVGAMVD